MSQIDSTWKSTIDTIDLVALPLMPFEEERQSTTENGDLGVINQLNTTAVQVQGNGPGLLATPLIHGMGARHTAVLWNGLNLQSPINGTIDLQLLRNSMQIEVLPVSMSPASGSAATAGAIILDEQKNQTKLGLQYNNTDNFDFQIGTRLRLDKVLFRFDLQAIDYQNRYTYRFGGDKLTQNNAAFSGSDLKFSAKNNTNHGWQWKTAFWWQAYNREVAAAKTALYNEAMQADENFRWFLGLQKNQYFQLNAGLLKEEIIYRDASVLSRAKNHGMVLRIRSSNKWVTFFTNFRSDCSETSFFTETIKRNNIGLGASRTLSFFEKWTGSITLRKEFIEEFLPPLLYDFSLRYLINDIWKVSVSIDRSYNLPTFNDLFWPTGGNPDLQPESGRGYDLSISKGMHNRWSSRILIYQKIVDNWILWSPGIPFWSPRNQRKVRSRGIDFLFRFNHSIGRGTFSYQTNFYYNQTTILEDENNGRVIGKQLIYVPRFRWTSTHFWHSNTWDFHLFSQYFGDRFTSFDNQNKIAGFFVLDLSIGKQIGSGLRWHLTIHNILNTNYEQVAFYPMPLRNFTIGIKYQ